MLGSIGGSGQIIRMLPECRSIVIGTAGETLEGNFMRVNHNGNIQAAVDVYFSPTRRPESLGDVSGIRPII